MRGVQILVLALALPREPPAPPHVGPALAPAGLGGVLLEGVGRPGRVRVGRRLVQQRAQVQKMLLGSGTLIPGVDASLGDEGGRGHVESLSGSLEFAKPRKSLMPLDHPVVAVPLFLERPGTFIHPEAWSVAGASYDLAEHAHLDLSIIAGLHLRHLDLQLRLAHLRRGNRPGVPPRHHRACQPAQQPPARP